MKITDLRPCALLRPYLSRYWVWDGEAELPAVLLPGTGAELLFQYAAPIRLNRAQHGYKTLASGVLLSPRVARFELETVEPVGFVAVRFRSGALRHFCAMPVSELTDQCPSVSDIWGEAGREIEARVIEPQSLHERIQRIETFLLTQLQRHRKTEYPWLDGTFHRLYYQQTPVSIDSLARDVQVSIRHFQKVFKQTATVSPKHFQRIARVETITRQALLGGKKRYLELALDHGYYDQAHFIKDFRQFSGSAPSHFFREKNFRTHFYNYSLPV